MKTKFEKMVCYKKEYYMSSGWCKTYGWNIVGYDGNPVGGWGICSESCKYLKNEITGRPEDYDKV